MNMVIYRSHSWTNFGVGSVRELVWESMAQSDNHAYVNVEIDAIGDMNEIGVVSNPCLFKGYTQVHKNVTHIGSGNATECANVVKSVLWKHHTSEDETDLRHVCHYDRLDNEIDVNLDSDAAADSLLQFNNEGLFENIMDSIHAEDAEMEVVRIEGETEEELMRYVEEQTSDSDSLLGSKSMSSSPSSFTLDNANETPHRVPCPLNNVKLHLPLSEEFYAMSVYYYAFDCVRTLGPVNVSWPTPTVLELERAVSEFCSFGDWEYIEENWIGKHENTFASQMPVRCFESTYLVTLLRYAFGFSDNFNGINYAPEVDGVTAVEWPIGFLLTHIAVDHPSLSH